MTDYLPASKLFLSIGLLNIPQSVFAHCKYPDLKGDMKLGSLSENSKLDLPV